jgi:hypothetical protein
VEKLETPNGYVGVFKKTYKGSSVIILVNLSDFEEIQIDISAYGSNLKLCDTLNVSGKTTLNGKTLTMQPYSIAILK